MSRILNALDIHHVGEQTAIDLAAWLAAELPRAKGETDAAWTRRAADHLRDASVDELTAVFGIGRVVAEAIARFFADEHAATRSIGSSRPASAPRRRPRARRAGRSRGR